MGVRCRRGAGVSCGGHARVRGDVSELRHAVVLDRPPGAAPRGLAGDLRWPATARLRGSDPTREASSINPSDMHPTVARDAGLPHVMGSDISGTVVGVDAACAESSSLRVGDNVWGDIGANTRTKKSNAKTKELGSYAEVAVALDTQLGRMPRNIDFAEAASLPKVALTSWKALTWYAGALNTTFRGRRVLILGGSGGTGSTGIQISVLGTDSYDNISDQCRLREGTGANRSIDYHSEDWWDPNDPAGSVDVVYDCVGQTGTGDRAMGVLRRGGFYVTITGALATNVKEGVQQHMFINSDTNLDSATLLNSLRDLVERDALRMRRIDNVYALDTIPDAFEE